MKKIKRWLLAVSMAANQFVNALTGGDPDMAVSARAGYARERGSKGGARVCRVLEALDFHPWQRPEHRGLDHCEVAVINHEERVKKAAEEHDQRVNRRSQDQREEG